MSIVIDGYNISDIYIDGHYINEIYNGDQLIFQKSVNTIVDVTDYEYTLDNGKLILTKYIGTSPTKINPNI